MVPGPVYYKINKTPASYRDDYNLFYMDLGRLDGYKNPSAWLGFDTRAEAVEYAESRGWIKVDSWKQARELAKPHLEERARLREERARERDRQTFTNPAAVGIAVSDLVAGGPGIRVWVGADGQMRMIKEKS
ncbi:hypothetical protein SEA_COLT_43 [Mycobacterium phage Colt]|nr:hypothetical protein SEA_COLT_43 [Mycobacterium phage Colt]